MGSINLNKLKNTSKSVDNYTYVDLNLDMTQEKIGTRTGNWTTTTDSSKDIKVSYDLNAIQNSLVNLFNTAPGERYLLPEYGSDLRKYVFDNVSEAGGRMIGENIKDSIEKWEPRVRILNINIVGKADQNEYNITLNLLIPFSQTKFSLRGVLNQEGYTFT